MAPQLPPTSFRTGSRDARSSRAPTDRTNPQSSSGKATTSPMGRQTSYQAPEMSTWLSGPPSVPFQPEQLPLNFDWDMELAHLRPMFPESSQSNVSFSLPEQHTTNLPDMHAQYHLGFEPFLDQMTPLDIGAGGMLTGAPRMGANHDPRSSLSSGSMYPDPYFAPQSVGTDGLQAQLWDTYFGQDLSGSTSFQVPRTVGAGQESGISIHGRRHEAVASSSASTYLAPPTRSAGTRQTPESRPRPLTPTEQIPPQHICVVSLCEEWHKQRKGVPFWAADLPGFRDFCKDVLGRKGYANVPGLFSKPLKAMVGSEVSHTDRMNHRHEQTKGTFDCPVVECPSQCTRKHNLSLHLGAHIGLTPHHCEGCDKYFAASSINRHRDTCAGLKVAHHTRY